MDLWQALFILGGLIAQVFVPGFPKETLLLLAGSTFGLVIGSVINWLGMVIGAQLAYEVVRRSVELGGRFSSILEKYQNLPFVEYVRQRGNQGLFILRLVPTAPNDILSMLSGALFLRRRGYILVSLTTALPYAIFFAYLGDIGAEYLGKSQMWTINLVITAIALSVYATNLARQRLTTDSEEPRELSS